MSDQPLNDAWWLASNGKWYPPEQLPDDGSHLDRDGDGVGCD